MTMDEAKQLGREDAEAAGNDAAFIILPDSIRRPLDEWVEGSYAFAYNRLDRRVDLPPSGS